MTTELAARRTLSCFSTICESLHGLAFAMLSCVVFAFSSVASSAATYYYVNWTSANVAGGTAQGTITLPDASVVTVNFQALNSDGSPGSLYGAQTAGGTNYWVPSAPYTGAVVSNAPPDSDILQLSGGNNQTYRVTLSEPIRDPIMAIVSLGAGGTTITYNFNSPFTILSQGVGYWGGGPSALVPLAGNVLQGAEGHGTIQFNGSFSQFTWTVPTPETWHGFTFGIRTTERIEPTVTPGVPTLAPWSIAALFALLFVAGGLGVKTLQRSKSRA